jgi:hypothetical protein
MKIAGVKEVKDQDDKEAIVKATEELSTEMQKIGEIMQKAAEAAAKEGAEPETKEADASAEAEPEVRDAEEVKKEAGETKEEEEKKEDEK